MNRIRRWLVSFAVLFSGGYLALQICEKNVRTEALAVDSAASIAIRLVEGYGYKCDVFVMKAKQIGRHWTFVFEIPPSADLVVEVKPDGSGSVVSL